MKHVHRLAALLATLALTALPVRASDDEITLRINDSEAVPGGIATVVIRTYAPRPLGQGQISLGTTSRPRRLVLAPNQATVRGSAAAVDDSPFSAFLGGEVLSSALDAVVSFDFVDSGASPRLDISFASPSGSVNESDGPMAVLRFRVRDDVAPGSEYDLSIDVESASLVAPDGTPLLVEPRGGVLAIEDPAGSGGDDGGAGRLRFDLRSYSVAEGAGAAVITLERSQGDDGDVSVSFLTRDGSAGPGDYQNLSGTVSWADGDEAPKTFLLPIHDDSADETSETVLLELEAPAGGATLDFERSTAVLTIVDDDTPAADPTNGRTLRFTSTRLEVEEGSPEVPILVERGGPLDGSGTVEWQTVDGSAERGLDFQQDSGTLTWQDGEGGTRSIEVALFDDEVQEGNESLRVELLDPQGGLALDPTASEAEVVILDDDAERSACVGSEKVLCLQGGRFAIEVMWHTGSGLTGRASAVPDSDASGLFWFFERSNVEMLVKVLDGCQVAGLEGWWVFYSATTDLGLVVSITDTVTGLTKEYGNQPGQTAPPVQDLSTFRSCPSP